MAATDSRDADLISDEAAEFRRSDANRVDDPEKLRKKSAGKSAKKRKRATDDPPAIVSDGGEPLKAKPRAKGKDEVGAPKKVKPAKVPPLRRQVAALPFRRTETGEAEVLIITSRETRRFVIPKGWPMKKRRKSEAAAVEAFEEAGVVGTVGRKPVGRYTYWKRLKDRFQLVRVSVYALEVREQVADWPEREQRLLSWLPPRDAAVLVDEPGLARIIKDFR